MEKCSLREPEARLPRVCCALAEAKLLSLGCCRRGLDAKLAPAQRWSPACVKVLASSSKVTETTAGFAVDLC